MIDLELIKKAKDYGIISILERTYSDNIYIGCYSNLHLYLNWFIEYKEKYSKNSCIETLIKSYNTENYFNYIKIAKLDIQNFNEYIYYLNERENIESYIIIELYFDYLKNILLLKQDEKLTYEEKYPKNLLTKEHIVKTKVQDLFIEYNKNRRWEIE